MRCKYVCRVIAPAFLAIWGLGVPDLSAAQPAASGEVAWITLGTQGGPNPSALRSEPANLLVFGKDAYLVDCGDGAIGQAAKAGYRLDRIKAVVISHLHFDHTGGLAALLGTRFQTSVPGKLMIYGPVGTKELVQGLLQSMGPAARAANGVPGAPVVDPASTVEVREIADGDAFTLDEVKVTSRRNSHFGFPPESAQARAFQSLSYRFDGAGRSIVYTGDTGPSEVVEVLAQGADMLVTEMVDVPAMVAQMHALTPDAQALRFATFEKMMSNHHLSTGEIGNLAQRAGVKSVLVTHLVAPPTTPESEARYIQEIAMNYRGPVVIAHDLERH